MLLIWIRIRIYQILWIHIIALNAKKLKCMRSRSQGASFLLITQALIIVFRGDAPQWTCMPFFQNTVYVSAFSVSHGRKPNFIWSFNWRFLHTKFKKKKTEHIFLFFLHLLGIQFLLKYCICKLKSIFIFILQTFFHFHLCPSFFVC